MTFYVTIRNRRVYFASLAEASDFANQYWRRTGVILGIEQRS